MNKEDWELVLLAMGMAIGCAIRDGDKELVISLTELIGKLTSLREELKKKG